MRGSLVREVARREFDPGHYPITWDGKRSNGAPAGAGIYFVQVRSPLGSMKLRIAMLP